MNPQAPTPQDKCVYVSDIRYDTGLIRDWFLITRLEGKSGPRGPFLTLEFADRTGTIPGIWWETDILEITARTGDIVKIKARTGEYKDKPQLVVEALFHPKPGLHKTPGLKHFFKASKFDSAEMLIEIDKLVEEHTDGPARRLIETVLHDDEILDRLVKAPAAMKYHHAYISGLLEHVLSLCRAAVALRTHYVFDLPIVLAGCILHDIGKCWELEWDRGTRYTRLGVLQGHIALGFSLVDRLCDHLTVDHNTQAHILHLIASHHGTKENGSPVEPATREAVIFHMLDKLDSTLAAVEAAEELPSDENDEMTAYIPSLRTRFIRSGTLQPEPAPVQGGARQETDEPHGNDNR